MIKSIPVETPNKKILPIKNLKVGLNKGVYFAGKVVNTLSKKGDIPVYLSFRTQIVHSRRQCRRV
jgi:hypothetical protein